MPQPHEWLFSPRGKTYKIFHFYPNLFFFSNTPPSQNLAAVPLVDGHAGRRSVDDSGRTRTPPDSPHCSLSFHQSEISSRPPEIDENALEVFAPSLTAVDRWYFRLARVSPGIPRYVLSLSQIGFPRWSLKRHEDSSNSSASPPPTAAPVVILAMQGHHCEALSVPFPSIRFVFRSGRRKSTKLPRDASTSSPSISKSDCWIGTISGYVAPLNTTYILDGGDPHWNLRSSETATADDGMSGRGDGEACSVLWGIELSDGGLLMMSGPEADQVGSGSHQGAVVGW
ncbi:hypothetical protein GQ457_11G022980 [Hibiscus cannabinus]